MAQEAVRNTRKRGRAPLSDMVIENTIQDLYKDLCEWVKSFSLPGEIPVPKKKKDEIDFLSMQDNPERKICELDDIPAIRKLPRGSTIFLQGMLSSFICSEIIEKPFLFLDSALANKPRESKGKSSPTISDTSEDEFEEIFMNFASKLAETDRYRANEWVSKLLEATKFLISPDLEDAKQLKGNTAFKNYHNHAKALAEKFLASPAHILLKEVHGQEICKRRNELISILKRYRELSFQLWYRVVEVKCYYLGSDLVPSTFDPASPAMELYTALEEDATGIESHKHKNLTGLRVMVIMKPAIVAHWVDQEDNKLERSKVWVKSVAWVYAREGSKESESQQGIVGKESNEHQETMGICEKNEEELPLNTDLGEENHEPQQVIGEDSDDEHEHDMDIDEECQEHQQEITTLDEKSNEPQQCIYEEREAEHQQEMDIDEKCPKTKKDMIEEIGETKTMSDKHCASS
ncbi:hypothetical protein VTN96DRAFT_5913 [Rasamsonia emersonii]